MRVSVFLVFVAVLIVFLLPLQESTEPHTSDTPVLAGSYTESTLRIAVRKPMSDYTAPRSLFDEGTFLHEGVERRWFWIAPEGDGPAPTVILLHGSMRNGAAMLDMMKSMAREGFFLIAPNSAVAEGWSQADDGPDFMAALLDHAETLRAIDRDRLFLVGHSAGASHALWLETNAMPRGARWRSMPVPWTPWRSHRVPPRRP